VATNAWAASSEFDQQSMIALASSRILDVAALERLQSPVLVIAGCEDTGATQAAESFLFTMREAKRPGEIFIYPGADHGYAQPFFNEGNELQPRSHPYQLALVQGFLATHLGP
jgi:hypothetical protein